MKYKINFNEWGSMFSVPSSVVDKHLKICSEVQLKVLLYVMKNSQTLPDENLISEALCVPSSEVENAISFWIDRKILISEEPDKNVYEDNFKPVIKPKPVKKKPLKPDSHFVAQKIREDRNIAALLEEAQQVLRKTLSPNDVANLVYFNDSLGLPCEVIVMLLHYCSSIDKANISYIEKLAIEWSDEEIFTLTMAEEKIKALSDCENAWNTVSKMFGLKMVTRPTKTQIRYANTWINEWHIAKPLINEAYDRCLDVKHSFDMAYINAILKKWHSKDIRNMDQLKKFDEQSKPSSKTPANKSSSKKGSVYSSETASYNLEDYMNKSIFDED